MNPNYLWLSSVFFLFISLSAQAAWDIEGLCRLMAQQDRVEVLYLEEKHLTLLDEAVKSSGKLLYIAPNQLEKRVELPLSQIMRFNRQQLSMTEGDKSYLIDASTMPEVSRYLESILNLLSGKKDVLIADFELELTGTEESWHLVMLPKNEQLKAIMRRAEIQGSAHRVQIIRLDQADGDWSIMQLSPLK
jgi:hypothetical protein